YAQAFAQISNDGQWALFSSPWDGTLGASSTGDFDYPGRIDAFIVQLAPLPPPPTVNGSSVAITVAPGATVSVGVTSGPGNPKDWLALYPTGAADSAYLDWFFLNGTKSAPAVGVTTATVPFTLPHTPGTYEVRFFANNTYQRLGTTPTVTVPPPPGAPASLTSNTSGYAITLSWAPATDDVG